MVNDSQKRPNCKMRKIEVDGAAKLCLFALRDISEGEELRYCYGMGEDFFWRKVIKSVF